MCGTSLAGRAEIAMALINRGFVYHSIGIAIDEELARRKLSISDENRAKVDKGVVKKFGKDAWARLILDKVREKDAIIDGIRHPEEVAALRRKASFQLVGVYSPTEVRFERALAQFVGDEKREGKEDAVADETLEEYSILKHIDHSIPYPIKGLDSRLNEILKKK